MKDPATPASRPTQDSEFDELGFVVADPLLSAAEVDVLSACLSGEETAGARNLLRLGDVRAVARRLRGCRQLGDLLQGYVAVQCTSFIKSQSKNWAVRLHRDRVIPASGGAGWAASGTKDGMEFVRPPRTVLADMVAVRLNLDAADEGDLQIVPGSHVRTSNSQRSAAVPIPVRKGGALVMRPLLEHASTKLKRAEARRVLHFLFGPANLPNGYRWYHAV